jgi:hypothetical protein
MRGAKTNGISDHSEAPRITIHQPKEITMNTNELQDEVDSHDEIRELTVDELDTIGGGGGGPIGGGGPVVH